MEFALHIRQNISRYVRTLRYYRSKQLVFWILNFLKKQSPRYFQSKFWQTERNFKWSCLDFRADVPNNPDLLVCEISKGYFTFLNKTIDLGFPVNWNPEGVSRLWTYNLHYFDYLLPVLRLDYKKAWNLVVDWITNNLPGSQNSWDPFPLSLRIVNWIQAFSEKLPPHDVRDQILRSLYQQTLFLEKSLEWHLLANHLFKNAKALAFAGIFFSSKDSDRWLKKGVGILMDQVNEQILADGGHFERSPMYHAMILKDCLDLLNIDEICIANRKQDLKVDWKRLRQHILQKIPYMMRFLSCMTHPDGKIALFNDAAFNIEPDYQHLLAYSRNLNRHLFKEGLFRTIAFEHSGYFLMKPSLQEYLVIDCGPIGPDYQPGHAHSDAMSFELSIMGRRVVVDSGTYQYESSEMRDYNRGNKGHNSLTINGENQSEVWGAHRCARRAKPIYAHIEEVDNNYFLFEGAHDGYVRLPGSPVHHRKILWERPRKILIEDKVSGTGKHDIELRLHIHPSFEIERDAPGVKVTCNGTSWLTILPVDGGIVGVKDGWYCPEFGKKQPCKVLVLEYRSVQLPFKSGWILEW